METRGWSKDQQIGWKKVSYVKRYYIVEKFKKKKNTFIVLYYFVPKKFSILLIHVMRHFYSH